MAQSPRNLQPPGGSAPPLEATFPGGPIVRLEPLADAVCAAYYKCYGDEDLRYGTVGRAWCKHDNQHLLAWAAQEAVRHDDSLDRNIDWLCRVLAARSFPLERLAHDLQLAAIEVESLAGGDEVADQLRRAADRVAETSGVAGNGTE